MGTLLRTYTSYERELCLAICCIWALLAAVAPHRVVFRLDVRRIFDQDS